MIFGSEIVVINFDQELQQIKHKNSKEIKNEAFRLQWFWIVSRQSLFLSLNIIRELCQKFYQNPKSRLQNNEMDAEKNKTWISCWFRSEFLCVCWREYETDQDQDGPREIHWNFASRNTMMPARLTDLTRIWPLLSLPYLHCCTVSENIQYQTFVTKNTSVANFKSQKKLRSSKISNPMFLSWKRNGREGCLWCW